MKTSIMAAIAAVATMTVTGQITKEHTFERQASPFYTDKGVMYVGSDTSNVYLYNGDYTLYKKVAVAPIKSIAYRNVYLSSDKLFNADASIEFIVTEMTGSNSYKSVIMNENGEKIFDLTNCYYPILYNNEGKTYLQTTNIINSKYSTIIYALPGKENRGLQTQPTTGEKSGVETESDELRAYPVPSRGLVTLTYGKCQAGTMMLVNDASGRIVATFPTDPTGGVQLMDAGGLQGGVYRYAVGGEAGSFVVE